MSEIENMPSDELWKKIADSPREEGSEKIEKALNESWKGLKKTKTPFTLGKDGVKGDSITIRIPDKNVQNKVGIGIDETTYELVIETSMGWRRTGKIIKTILPKEKAS